MAQSTNINARVAALLGDSLLTPAEVAAATRLHPATIRRRAKQGTFPKPLFLSPRRRVWKASVVKNWIDSHAAAVADAA